MNKRLTAEQLQSQISPLLLHCNPTEDKKGKQTGKKEKKHDYRVFIVHKSYHDYIKKRKKNNFTTICQVYSEGQQAHFRFKLNFNQKGMEITAYYIEAETFLSNYESTNFLIQLFTE